MNEKKLNKIQGNLKKIIALLILCILLFVGGFWYYFNNKKIYKIPYIEKTLFIKNETWWTNWSNFIPYKKWDKLILTYILEDWKNNHANINTDKISEKINIKEIFVNNKKVPKDELSNIKYNEIIELKIIWEAIKNNEDNENFLEYIKSETSQKPEIKEEKEEFYIDKTISPFNVNFNKNSFISNTNNLLKISWANLETIDYVIIWEKRMSHIFKNWEIYINIEKNTFDNWDFFVWFYLKNWNLVAQNKKITFIFDKNPISISDITPRVVKRKVETSIVLQWNWFSKIMSLQLSNNYIFKKALFKVINDQVAVVKIPWDLEVWEYYFNIMDIKWIYSSKNISLIIEER